MASQYINLPVSGSSGAVTGPASSVNNDIATFNGTTGKIIKDSGVSFPIPIASGGTGQTSQGAAINALLPAQAAHNGQFLVTNGSNPNWQAITLSPAGANTQIQFNDSGVFGAVSGLSYIKSSNVLFSIKAVSTPPTFTIQNSAADVTTGQYGGGITLVTGKGADAASSGSCGPGGILDLRTGVGGDDLDGTTVPGNGGDIYLHPGVAGNDSGGGDGSQRPGLIFVINSDANPGAFAEPLIVKPVDQQSSPANQVFISSDSIGIVDTDQSGGEGTIDFQGNSGGSNLNLSSIQSGVVEVSLGLLVSNSSGANISMTADSPLIILQDSVGNEGSLQLDGEGNIGLHGDGGGPISFDTSTIVYANGDVNDPNYILTTTSMDTVNMEFGTSTAGIGAELNLDNGTQGFTITATKLGLMAPVTTNNTLSVGGSLTIASTTPIVGAKSATATLDFPSIAALASSDLTITVTGAAVNDSVMLGLPAIPAAGIVFFGFVSASNTVTIRAMNITALSVNPASATYRATVIQF